METNLPIKPMSKAEREKNKSYFWKQDAAIGGGSGSNWRKPRQSDVDYPAYLPPGSQRHIDPPMRLPAPDRWGTITKERAEVYNSAELADMEVFSDEETWTDPTPGSREAPPKRYKESDQWQARWAGAWWQTVRDETSRWAYSDSGHGRSQWDNTTRTSPDWNSSEARSSTWQSAPSHSRSREAAPTTNLRLYERPGIDDSSSETQERRRSPPRTRSRDHWRIKRES